MMDIISLIIKAGEKRKYGYFPRTMLFKVLIRFIFLVILIVNIFIATLLFHYVSKFFSSKMYTNNSCDHILTIKRT